MKDGGPAFPNVSFYQEEQDGKFSSQVDNPGMSLRQYAAIKAMHGLIIRGFTIHSFAARPDMLAQLIKDSYDIADAILDHEEK